MSTLPHSQPTSPAGGGTGQFLVQTGLGALAMLELYQLMALLQKIATEFSELSKANIKFQGLEGQAAAEAAKNTLEDDASNSSLDGWMGLTSAVASGGLTIGGGLYAQSSHLAEQSENENAAFGLRETDTKLSAPAPRGAVEIADDGMAPAGRAAEANIQHALGTGDFAAITDDDIAQMTSAERTQAQRMIKNQIESHDMRAHTASNEITRKGQIAGAAGQMGEGIGKSIISNLQGSNTSHKASEQSTATLANTVQSQSSTGAGKSLEAVSSYLQYAAQILQVIEKMNAANRAING